jgi:hypothetical protein
VGSAISLLTYLLMKETRGKDLDAELMQAQ